MFRPLEMEGEMDTPTTSPVPRRVVIRGGGVVNIVWLTAAVILVAALAGTGWWLTGMQHDDTLAQRRQELRTVTALLADAAGALIDADQLTPVRRLVADSASRHGMTRCRIVLADGGVLADSDPARADADLPRRSDYRAFDAGPPSTETLTGDTLALVQPLPLTGRGTARLEIDAPIYGADAAVWQLQAGLGLIGGASLLAMLVAYRLFNKRLRAMAAIRAALLGVEQGESDVGALGIAPHLGDAARAWNRMVAEQQMLRQRSIVDEVRQRLNGSGAGGGELAAGCDALAQGMVLVDEQMRVQYANRSAALFLQTEHETLVGRSMAELVTDTNLLEHVQAAALGTAHRRASIEIDQADAEDGTTQGVLRFTSYPLKQGDATVALLVIEDITQARVAEQSRHAFVAQATHELRTPLTNMRLYLETAIDEGDADPDLRANCLNVINDEAGRLERIVTDMLSVAEIESGSMKLNRNDVRMDELLRGIEADYQAQADAKGIGFAIHLPPKTPVIQADREKLAAAVHNLVGNAIKYTPDGGKVNVTLDVGPREMSIEVVDTGLGIAPDDATRVFEKFYRASDRRIKGITGTGLGLALAREMVRLHGGDIALQSQLDQGSTFTVTLPISENNE